MDLQTTHNLVCGLDQGCSPWHVAQFIGACYLFGYLIGRFVR